MCDDWTKKILEQLEKDKNSSVQSSLPQQQNLEVKIKEIDTKISKLIDVYLAESLTLEEYQAKKEAFINEKRKLQDNLRNFAAGANNWFEPAREFVTSLNSAHCAMEEENLESQKEFLEKIGSNFILKERRLNFSTEASFRPLFEAAPYPCWRVVVDGRRTLRPVETMLLVKLYRKRSMGSLIALDEPINTTLPYKKGVLSKYRL
ncbi:MAG: hypothetical protein V2A59_02880 [Candidatus Omnitrophota bacterium]